MLAPFNDAPPDSTPIEPPGPPPRRRLRLMISLTIMLLLMAVLLAIASNKIQFQKVISGSMEPNLLIGDVVLVDANQFPNRYDIVCLKDPEDTSQIFVKRVIGLPGDVIAIRDSVLYVNGHEEKSDHVSSNTIAWKNVRIVVPDDTLFVLGDNRNNSYDSLNYGPVPFANLTGTVKWIIEPLNRIGHPQALHDPTSASKETASASTD